MQEKSNGYNRARRKRTLVASLIIFILIPITIFMSIRYLDDRKYLFISMLIITYVMVPFFLIFEERKPMARELVLIGVMSALTVCGIGLSYMTIPFQAGTALVIITGISLGPEAGFLTGAVARFVSNFFLGQGPWTPWQMFCWGILGFISGMVFNKDQDHEVKSRDFKVVMGPLICIIISLSLGFIMHILRDSSNTFFGCQLYVFGALGLLAGLLIQRKRLPIDDVTLSLYGFFTTFIIYGGIMNIAAMVMSSSIPASGITISLKSLKALYISGAGYDAVHGLGSAFFLFVMGEKVIKKMERVKIKYGLY